MVDVVVVTARALAVVVEWSKILNDVKDQPSLSTLLGTLMEAGGLSPTSITGAANGMLL